MSVPDKNFNFRAEQAFHDVMELRGVEAKIEKGPLARKWVMERLVIEEALTCLKRCGLAETLNRLSKPTYESHTANSTTVEEPKEVHAEQCLALRRVSQ